MAWVVGESFEEELLETPRDAGQTDSVDKSLFNRE
jgi:hypothetical protein